MNKKIVWKWMLALGLMPLILPVGIGLYKMMIESWLFLDWLILYSFLYYPTYIIGLVMVIISIYKLKRGK